ncbi:glycosyltransferase, partial [Microvirga antarctica]|uniref:glycosyltransferase n=1 Tax=Microvirga antarctica TaxID=2819233 RepID=UPI001B3131DA
GGFDVVVAVDLDTLPAAIALAEEYGVPVIYDAHEYWPYSNPDMRHWEIDFWSNLEKSLVAHTALRVAVSPQMAHAMGSAYECTFGYIPNCTSLGSEKDIDLEATLARNAERSDVRFLYQGNFSPFRGIEKLIDAWDSVDPRAKLWLRGPDSRFKMTLIDQARRSGLLDHSVFFPDAVAETELVAAARESDVGLIPYEPQHLNYRFASPNKLSQYMAAGMPIITNEIEFVKSLVVANELGSVVNFSDKTALAHEINRYVADRPLLQAQSRKAKDLFMSTFNWQIASKETFEQINALVMKGNLSQRAFNFPKLLADRLDRGKANADLTPHEIQVAELEHTRDGMQIEIDRMQAQFDARMGEINSYYTKATEGLNEELSKVKKKHIETIDEMNGHVENLNAEIGRLNSVYMREIERLRKPILVRLLGRGRAAIRRKSVGSDAGG